jgi:hypothetical protein
MARITPVLLTLATDGALELQVIARSVSTCPLADRVIAVAWVLLPTVSDDWGAVRVMVATGTGITVNVAVALFPSLEAVITVVPTASVVIAPLLSTVATAGVDELHATERPVSVAPRSSRSTALAVVVAPSVSDGNASVTTTVATGAGITVSVALPVFPSLVAVMVAEPAAMADTVPPSFTVATVGDDDVQLTTRPVTAAPAAVRRSAVAFTVPPTVIWVADNATATEATPVLAAGGVGLVAPSPPPPPHALRNTNALTASRTRRISHPPDCGTARMSAVRTRWNGGLTVSAGGGFPRGELARVVMMVQGHAVDLPRSWDDDVAD